MLPLLHAERAERDSCNARAARRVSGTCACSQCSLSPVACSSPAPRRRPSPSSSGAPTGSSRRARSRASITLVRAGRPPHRRRRGGRRHRARRKARPDDRFWVGSVTKSFVATVVMQLVAEGRLGLDDTVERLLPGASAKGGGSASGTCSTTRAGSRTTCGLEPWSSAVARNPRVVIPARRLVSSAAGLPLEFAPGSRASYSNTNYLVLAEILERVTGRPLARCCGNASSSRSAYARRRTRAGGERVGGDQMHGYDVSGPRPRDVSLHGLGGPWADGAIVSNARDLAVFFGALLRGKLVPPRLVAQMRDDRAGLARRGPGPLQARRRPAAAGSTDTPAARPATSPSPRARATAAASSSSP